ncbi:MAG: DMT family transporter [Alphaproteobacteria bacterium]|nr:DMT family transporter [Alphaproteobacteria bacterium]
MSSRARALWLAAMPGLFVFLWSTGFIGAKFGLPFVEPCTFLAIRFWLVAGLLLALSLAMKAPWPKGTAQILHIALAGLLVHGVYLGGVFASIHQGVEAGVSALIVGVQPLLTALLAGPVLGERVTLRAWVGLVLGFGGVALVVWNKLGLGLGTPFAMGLSGLALLGMTAGTIHQKKFCAGMDIRSGGAIQFVAAAAMMTLLASIFETGVVDPTPQFWFALGWLVFVMSLGAITLLYILIRQGEAYRVSTLFYLVPASTALIALVLFDERLGPTALGGMALAAIGVALVNLPAKPR